MVLHMSRNPNAPLKLAQAHEKLTQKQTFPLV